jgi:hypothetical protein
MSLGIFINNSNPKILPSAANNPPGNIETAPTIEEKDTIKTEANKDIFVFIALSVREIIKPSKDQEITPIIIANNKGLILKSI